MQTQQDILYNKITKRFENRLIYNIYESKLKVGIRGVFLSKCIKRQEDSLHTYFCTRLSGISLRSANSRSSFVGLCCQNIFVTLHTKYSKLSWHYVMCSDRHYKTSWIKKRWGVITMPFFFFASLEFMLPWQLFLVAPVILADQADLELHWPLEDWEVLGDPVTCS